MTTNIPLTPAPTTRNGQGNDKNENITLHQCSRNGDTEKAKRLLESEQSQVDINKLDHDNLTALHYAVLYNKHEMVKLLVEKNADIKVKDKDGLTALHFAARLKWEPQKKSSANSQCSIIGCLVQKDSDVSQMGDQYGLTPLHYACMRGKEDACEELLKHPNIAKLLEAVDVNGSSPLHKAVTHKQIAITKTLIESKADIHARDVNGSTPLHLACSEGSEKIVDKILKAGGEKILEQPDGDGNSCLSLAVENNQVAFVKVLLRKHKAKVNTENKMGMSPLHVAAMKGYTDIVKELLRYKADIFALDNENATPLHKAAQYDNVQALTVLIESSKNEARTEKLDPLDEDQLTPLLIASAHGRATTVDVLIQEKTNISATDNYGKTMIYLAAEGNHVAALEIMFAKGTDQSKTFQEMINVGDRDENTPIHVAAKKGFVSVVQILLQNGVNVKARNYAEKTPLHLAAKFGRAGVVQELVEKDKYLRDDEDRNWNTALHLAAFGGHTEIVKVLLEYGANVDSRNVSKYTPLDCAALCGWTSTVKVLLDADSPVNPKGESKKTPLHLAALHGHTEVVELLLESDVDADATFDHLNCLDYAIESNNSNTALAIVKSRYWERCMRNIEDNDVPNTPMRKLIRKMPDVAEEVLTRCITIKGEDTNTETKCSATLNYEFLLDKASGSSMGQENETGILGILGRMKTLFHFESRTQKTNHPLMIMVKNKRKELLTHPLVTALIDSKWNFSCKVYYLNFALYVFFLIFLTGFLISSEAPYLLDTSSIRANGSDCEKLYTEGHQKPGFTNVARAIVILYVVLSFIREILQLVWTRSDYICWENLLDCTTYIFSLLFVIDVDECQGGNGYRFEWQWYIGTIAIFLAWINLTVFVQMLPRIGIYVVMIKDVLKTFLQFFLVFMLFIVAFALAFYALLQKQETFATVWLSMVKTTVMTIGEFDYGDIFAEDGAPYRTFSYMVFCVFMVIMSIIVMNLLVGLAVDNIQDILKHAELTVISMKVDLILHVERSVLGPIIRRRFGSHRTETFTQSEQSFLDKSLGKLSYIKIKDYLDTVGATRYGDEETVDQNENSRQWNIVDEVKDIRANQKKLEEMLQTLIQRRD